ncbi:MAG: hypothetical protein AB8B61_01860 [Cyclobacteriaceae bacterium]
MSSHHTIRENQEPAIALLDPLAINESVLMDLLEWSPQLVISEQCIDWVISKGLKIDIVLQKEFTESEITDKLANQFPILIKRYEGSVMDASISTIQENGNPSAQLFLDYSSYTLEGLHELVISYPGMKVTFLNRTTSAFFPTNNSLTKWLPKGRKISLLSSVPVFVNRIISENEFIPKKEGNYTFSSDKSFLLIEEL